MQILRRIKSWYGRGNSAWDGNNGLDADLVHIDNHLPNITYAGIVTSGTATSASAAAVPGRAQLFVDGTYAVTNRDIGGSLVVQAYSPIAGALASNGTAVLVNTGSAWVNVFASLPAGSISLSALQLGALPAGISITGAQVMGAVAQATYAIISDHAINADYATTAGSLTGGAASAPGLMTVASIPATNVGDVIIVSAPHQRFMIWNGTAYVRAPWHQPGMVQYSIDNPASIPGYLPVRGDVVYAQANYPDLVARLGLSGTGNFSLLELRGEFIRCLDNGRAVDSARVHASAQNATKIQTEVKEVASNYGFVDHTGSDSVAADSQTTYFQGFGVTLSKFTASSPAAGANLNRAFAVRPRNVALPAWVSY